MVMIRGIKMCCKSVMANLLAVVCLLVKSSTAIAKPKDSLEAYIYIREPPIKVTSISHGISPFPYSYLFYISILISKIRSHQSIG